MSESVRRISPLADTLISQIAAGEVIERPASVVKELLENSLDAGASRIEITIEQGGRKLIRIMDDGCGILPDDLPLAVTRHATSKIHSFNELCVVRTMGFRGEALASIASVSRLILTSRTADDQYAWQIQRQPNQVMNAPSPVAHPQGTTIDIQELFFNTPVRRKFLRSDRTEFQHILERVRRLALGNPDVAFKLLHDGRTLFNMPATSPDKILHGRIEKVFGNAFSSSSIPVETERDGLRLTGWLGPVELSRSQSDRQYFYLNGRLIRDANMNHAVKLAYSEYLGEGRHPVYLLRLDMPLDDVDINVHPAKSEVRFREPRRIHDFIAGSLLRILRPARPDLECLAGRDDLVSAVQSKRETAYRTSEGNAGRVSDQRPTYNKSSGDSLVPAHSGDSVANPLLLFRPLSCIGGRYLILSEATDLLLVDIHQVFVIWVEEHLLQSLDNDGISSMPLLIPIQSKASNEQLKQLKGMSEKLSNLGLDIICTGPNAVMLKSIPVVLRGCNTQQLLVSLLTLFNLPFEISRWVSVLAKSASPENHDLKTVAGLDRLWKLLAEVLLTHDLPDASREFGEAELAQLFKTKE